MINKLLNFFDKLEDRVRYRLSKYPLLYAFIGGVGIVLFWRGVWGLSEEMGFSNLEVLIISTILLLISGLFVSFFIGDQFIISSLRGEKKIIEKTKDEILAEGNQIDRLVTRIDKLEKKIDKLLRQKPNA